MIVLMGSVPCVRDHPATDAVVTVPVRDTAPTPPPVKTDRVGLEGFRERLSPDGTVWILPV